MNWESLRPGFGGEFENVDAHFPGNVSKAKTTVKCIFEETFFSSIRNRLVLDFVGEMNSVDNFFYVPREFLLQFILSENHNIADINRIPN
ncbi:CLUMA_CG005257, isoform A [Clunio marinus]|uniref:CLUMA_CG005257, isoform A n=1 Tax=Clunio marinus TaxID=568069 RepID=A0A1J1HUC2_9DIPT|nr:CLUMA_CG005257, isoform A [Clunio marinus]